MSLNKIPLYYVDGRNIAYATNGLAGKKLKTVKGSMKLHQVLTDKENEILARMLSSLYDPGYICSCFDVCNVASLKNMDELSGPMWIHKMHVRRYAKIQLIQVHNVCSTTD